MRTRDSRFGFFFKRWVVAHNVGLLVSLFVCYLLVLWEYGNVCMGIWECMYGNRECGMYGNMGM